MRGALRRPIAHIKHRSLLACVLSKLKILLEIPCRTCSSGEAAILKCNLIAGAFDDDDVTHVEGEVNPIRDFDIISDELRLKDIDILKKELEKVKRDALRDKNDKKLKAEYVMSM